MKTIIFLCLSILLCFNLCQSQTTLEKVNKNSKIFTRKAMYLMDSTYFLKSHKDTIRYLQAISYLDSAIFYDSTNYFAYWKESQFLSELKRYNKALNVISNYTRSHKENIDFILRKAYLSDKVGDSISAKSQYDFILKLSNQYLRKEPSNKKLMMVKYFMLLLLKDNNAENYLIEIKNKFPNDEEIDNLVSFGKSFNKNKFIDYQLTGGESEDIQIH